MVMQDPTFVNVEHSFDTFYDFYLQHNIAIAIFFVAWYARDF